MASIRSTLALAALITACGRSSLMEPPPSWLLDLIEEIESEPVSNPPTQIARWEFASGVFYYRPPRCCDIWSELYDSDGTLLCHPDGGITGSGDGQCPDLGERLSERIIWSDPRA